MSRIGRAPIKVPAGVEISTANSVITVKGPLGTLTQDYDASVISINVENGEAVVSRANEENATKAKHGLYRALLNNMVIGVTQGFTKELDINGVGYRAAKQGKTLVLNLGYSHQVEVDEIDGITIDVPNPIKLIINGIDKQKVGQFAANIREKRPPEPYKGKGIKYTDEVIKRKEGKTGK